ncbi:MAG: hypothetical protein JWR59_258 [Brevundimonas sp.]|nr:hypothetical protein [Brevundimonas sp.]
MRDHESALQKGLIAWLKADEALQALLGEPTRIWDEPPMQPGVPHLRVGGSQSRAVNAEGCGIEHTLTLHCVSRFGGTEEARAICAAVRARLEGATVEADGVRTISLRTTFTDIFRSADLRRTYGVIRVRAVTEDI